MNKRYFVTGIGTDVGKTVVSAILTEALKANYWKPIQAGSLHFTDTDLVRSLVSTSYSVFYKESYLLNLPMSPHAAAERQSININLSKIVTPITTKPLIIEGAGGLLVPLNQHETILDLIKQLDVEVILVSRHYLGSINHTLLTYEVLKTNNIKVKGIVFNGKKNADSESIIIGRTGYSVLFHLDEEPAITKEIIKKYAQKVTL